MTTNVKSIRNGHKVHVTMSKSHDVHIYVLSCSCLFHMLGTRTWLGAPNGGLGQGPGPPPLWALNTVLAPLILLNIEII